MNRINQLFNSNKKDILSIYFCAGDPVPAGLADIIVLHQAHRGEILQPGQGEDQCGEHGGTSGHRDQ